MIFPRETSALEFGSELSLLVGQLLVLRGYVVARVKCVLH